MNVTQICIGRFHHFHLARQLEKHHLLERFYTGYPQFRLKDETGIPQQKIDTFPWFHAPYMFLLGKGFDKSSIVSKTLSWVAHETLDRYVATKLNHPSVVVSLSSTGLHTGRKSHALGGRYICDRGSTHITYQENLLKEEYKFWGFEFKGIDARIATKELKEYEEADLITVPSEFVKQSFIGLGIKAEKLHKVTYGARLDRFSRVKDPEKGHFRIIWVGAITIRKGFMYLLKAFQKLSHPHKELLVVGQVSKEVKALLNRESLNNVTFLGQVPNTQLPHLYSSSHVFVLSSIEEGLAMVQGEAMACGCPLIATPNTGIEDLITDGIEGFVVPIRSVEEIFTKLQQLVDQPILRDQMGENALEKVKSLGGWDQYGERYVETIKSLNE